MIRTLSFIALLTAAGFAAWCMLRPRTITSPTDDWDAVDTASDDSFPCSDSPSFTPVTGVGGTA